MKFRYRTRAQRKHDRFEAQRKWHRAFLLFPKRQDQSLYWGFVLRYLILDEDGNGAYLYLTTAEHAEFMLTNGPKTLQDAMKTNPRHCFGVRNFIVQHIFSKLEAAK